MELDRLERKTQMIIDLLTSTEEYGGTRKMILTCPSAEANTDKEQSLRKNVMRKNAINLDCGTLMTDYTTDHANNDTLSTNINRNFISKKHTINGVHKALWINPRRGVLITYFDKWFIRQIQEYQQLQEGKLLPSVDLIDCDTISISQEYQSDCGLASADPPSMFTGTNGISCDMKCVESYESAKGCLISPEMYYYPLYSGWNFLGYPFLFRKPTEATCWAMSRFKRDGLGSLWETLGYLVFLKFVGKVTISNSDIVRVSSPTSSS